MWQIAARQYVASNASLEFSFMENADGTPTNGSRYHSFSKILKRPVARET